LLLNKGRPVEWGLSSEVVLKYRKLLHDEEAAYFAGLTKSMAERARHAPLPTAPPVTAPSAPERTDNDNTQPGTGARSDRLSFGDGEVKIIKVETLNAEGHSSTIFHPGEKLFIRVACEAQQDISNLSVIVRLRNKEGIKIYSWGTLNQDLNIWATGKIGPTFWDRSFAKKERFEVVFECDARLGENLYEVQAAVSHEKTPNYLSQRMLHWMDEAAFFQVLMERNIYLFSGVADLGMQAKWNNDDR
jgi:lipopolysaccharide transport system ATP-binding protein